MLGTGREHNITMKVRKISLIALLIAAFAGEASAAVVAQTYNQRKVGATIAEQTVINPTETLANIIQAGKIARYVEDTSTESSGELKLVASAQVIMPFQDGVKYFPGDQVTYQEPCSGHIISGQPCGNPTRIYEFLQEYSGSWPGNIIFMGGAPIKELSPSEDTNTEYTGDAAIIVDNEADTITHAQVFTGSDTGSQIWPFGSTMSGLVGNVTVDSFGHVEYFKKNDISLPSIVLNGSNQTGSFSFFAPTSAGTGGQVLYTTGTGAPLWTTGGAAGQVLKSNGSGAPTWGTASGGIPDFVQSNAYAKGDVVTDGTNVYRFVQAVTAGTSWATITNNGWILQVGPRAFIANSLDPSVSGGAIILTLNNVWPSFTSADFISGMTILAYIPENLYINIFTVIALGDGNNGTAGVVIYPDGSLPSSSNPLIGGALYSFIYDGSGQFYAQLINNPNAPTTSAKATVGDVISGTTAMTVSTSPALAAADMVMGTVVFATIGATDITSSSATLNVNNTGAHTILLNGSTLSSSNKLSANSVYSFVLGANGYFYAKLLNPAAAASSTGTRSFVGSAAVSGTTAMTLTTTYPAFTAADLVPGTVVLATIGSTAVAVASTLNVNGSGAKPVWQGTSAVGSSNTLIANATYSFTYDGTNWNAILINNPAAGAGGTTYTGVNPIIVNGTQISHNSGFTAGASNYSQGILNFGSQMYVVGSMMADSFGHVTGQDNTDFTLPTVKLNGNTQGSQLDFWAPTTGGTIGQVLTSNGTSAPTWGTATGGLPAVPTACNGTTDTCSLNYGPHNNTGMNGTTPIGKDISQTTPTMTIGFYWEKILRQ